MKKKLVVIAISTCLISFILPKGVVGRMFPDMTCEDYNGKNVQLPATAKGKITLIGMAFSNAAEEDMKTWIDPIYNTFIPSKKQKENSNPFDFSSVLYDINLYFVPMFTKANQVMSKGAKQKIKDQSSPELYPYLLFYEGDKTYKEELDFEKKDVPYFFVLDKTGKITYAASGKFSQDKLDDIIDAVAED